MDRQLFIFNGKPMTGKSILSRLINYDKAFIIDDFIIPDEKASMSYALYKRVMDYQWINSKWKDFEKDYQYIIVIVNTDRDEVQRFVEALQTDKNFEKWLISVCEFHRGDVY